MRPPTHAAGPTVRRRTVLRAGAAATALLAGCAGDGSSGPTAVETSEVAMTGAQFDPRNVRVDVGATVTWVNEDGSPHTVTSASDNWSADVEVEGGGRTTHTFEESGIYDVYCRFHGSADLSGMSMKVAVGDAELEAPLGGSDDGSY